tara:strand:+ start:20447 stop:21427 length:981 start_codon:yes stop_codon:yes gene_type:complete
MSYIGSRPANKPVTVNDIEDDAITSAKIATGTVVASDLGANSVDSSELVDGSVDLSHLSATGTKSSSTYLRGDNSFATVSAGTTLTGSTNNQVTTVSGANAIVGEAGLIFDGTKLGIGVTPTLALDISSTDPRIYMIDTTNAGSTYKTKFGQYNDTFLISTNNGDNDAIKIYATGEVTKPLQPAFMSLNGGGTTLANATDVTITLDTEKFDIGSNISGNTFTAPITGKYYFSGSVVADAGSGNNTRFSESHIYINCSNRKLKSGEEQHYTNVNDWWAMSVSGLIDMDANDTCTLTYFGRRQSGSGTCVTVGSSTDFRTGLSGYLVA